LGTLTIQADLSLGTADFVARVAHALAGGTGFTGRTFDADTGVRTDAFVARPAWWTLHGLTRRHATALDAHLSAFDTLVAGAGGDALSPRTDIPIRADFAFVQDTVAVIIDAVAYFCRQGTAGTTIVPQAFIYPAVAVIVLRVADLIVRTLVGQTAEGAVYTCASALGTDTGSTAGTDLLIAEFTFIGYAVAVIVQAVADFLDGLCFGIADHAALDTSLAAFATDPEESGITRGAAAGVVLVHLAITVLVLTVASLALGVGTSTATHHAFDAGGDADAAIASTTGNGAGQSTAGVFFVDYTVAIIVLLVADFRRRHRIGSTDNCAVGAPAHARSADARLARVTDEADSIIAFV